MLSLKFKFLLFEFVNFQSWLNFQKILITALQFETVLVTMASKKIYTETKILVKVADWLPTDLGKKLEKSINVWLN